MKRVILVISILFCAQYLFAQTKLSGSAGGFDASGGARYNKVNWELTYKFIEQGNNVIIVFSNPKITIPSDALYLDQDNKAYSKSDLGISTWPTKNQLPYNLSILLNISYQGNKYEVTTQCGGGGNCNDEIVAFGNQKKAVDITQCKLTNYEFQFFNGGGEDQLDRIISNLRNTKTSTKTSLGATNNTADLVPADNAGSPTAKTNVGTKKLTQAEIQARNEKSKENFEAELIRIEAVKAAKQDAITRESLRIKYEEEAHAANTAVLANGISSITDDIGNLIENIKEAKAKKRAIEAKNDEYQRNSISNYLAEAKQGDTTAILLLAKVYNVTKSIVKDGNDPIQAFYWLGKASDLGSANAMNQLITIILTGRAQKERWFYVKYNISYNEAYPWFIKYVENDKYKDNKFQYKVYQVLASMYSSGIGCTKDKERANKMKAFYNEWKDKK